MDLLNENIRTSGEEFAVAFEQKRLWDAGRPDLSDRVEHVTAIRSEGLGYDVSLSRSMYVRG
jgi:hypothetical protein